VFFYRETYPEIVSAGSKIGRQAFDTIYDLVWEREFKNILNVGRVWIKFRDEEMPFGTPLKEKRSHYKISRGDIIQIGRDFYMVGLVGGKKVEVID
jgi:hypothetical protein